MKPYQKEQSYLTEEVKKIYRRYMSKTDLSEEDVRQILNTSVSPNEIAELNSLVETVKKLR